MLQTPKATLEIKELDVDISKDGGSPSNLVLRIQLLPILVHMPEQPLSSDQSGDEGSSLSTQSPITTTPTSSPPFLCQKFSFSSEFGCDKYFSSL